MTVTVSLTVTRLPGKKGLPVVTESAAAFTTAGKIPADVGSAALSDIRGTGMMLIPSSDPSGTLDAEGCDGGVVDGSEAGAGFSGLVDVSSVVGTEITEAGAVVLFSVVEGIVVTGEPALFGVEVATTKELDKLDSASGGVGPSENVGSAALEKPVSDGFSVSVKDVTLPCATVVDDSCTVVVRVTDSRFGVDEVAVLLIFED